MNSEYSEHHPVNNVDDEVEDDTNNGHSLPDHPPLESCHLSSNKCNIPASSIIICLGIVIMLLIGTLVAVETIVPIKEENNPKSLFSDTIEFAPLPATTEPLTQIAFGSCINQNFPQPFWDTIASSAPNITILGGDNIYAKCTSLESCPSTLEAAYTKQMSNPSFMGAMKALPIIATLDNHDYGINDADRNNPYKDIAKRYFMDFFQVPQTDERRTRRDGVYTSYMYGDVKRGTSLQIILLDIRYACSEMGGRMDAENNDNETMLGDAQWEWLHEQFSQPADVRIVVSSIQLIATGHPFYCWNNISSKELQRFYKFISKSSFVGTTIILSGDRHVGGIYMHDLVDPKEDDPSPVNGNSSVVYEITASSLTHTIPLPPAAPDRYCWNPGGSTSEECDDPDTERLHPYVRVNNFASLSIDWDDRVVTAELVRTDPTAKSHAFDSSHVSKDWLPVPDSGEILLSVQIKF